MSELPWFGVTPRGWDVTPLYAVATERKRPNKDLRETNLLSLSYGNIVRKDINAHDGLLPASFETYQVVEADDIVLRMTDLQNDQRSLRSGRVTERGIITSAYLALGLRDVESRFMAYQMRAIDLMKVFYSMGGGLRQSISYGDLKRLPVLLPRREKQRAIADYLDRETAQIDAFIAKNEELIALLAERRVSIIAHGVSHGVYGDAELRDSGVPWIDAVPTHWEMRPTRTVLRTQKSTVGAAWDETPLLSLTKQGVILRDVEGAHGKFPASFEGYQHVYPGDLVFCLFDVDETPRTVGLVRTAGMVTGAYTRFTVDTSIADPRYLELYYIAIDEEKRFRPLYTGLRNVIKKDRFLSADIALPPLDEQREIVQVVDDRLASVDRMATTAARGIALARERRAALISAAVTGKIDVGVVA